MENEVQKIAQLPINFAISIPTNTIGTTFSFSIQGSGVFGVTIKEEITRASQEALEELWFTVYGELLKKVK